MQTVFWISLVVLVVALAVGWSLFCRTPEKHWRNEVRWLRRAAQARVWLEETTLLSLGARRAAEEQALCADTLHRLLTSISVSELDAYPGIGPVTVSKLRDAGYRDLAKLQDLPAEVPGVASKRLADVREAISNLTEQVRSRFLSGSYTMAADLGHSLTALRREFEDEEQCSRARLQVARQVLRQMEGPAAVARSITFGNYLRSLVGKAERVSIPATDLPDLEGLLGDAETKARGEAAARREAPVATAAVVSGRNGEAPAAVAVGPDRLEADLTGLLPARTAGTSPAARLPAAPLAVALREAPVARPVASPQVVLEIDPMMTLTADLVRRQYRLLHERCDPEKLKPFGPDFVVLAKAKREAIHAAAVTLLEGMGAKLETAPAPAPPQELRHNPDLDALFGV